MLPLIILAALVLAPVLLALIFRVQALFVFVAIAAGYFLQLSLSDDVDLALATIVQGSDTLIIARLVLLLAPLVLTLFILRKTQGKSFVFQIVPLILSGFLLAALALPLLPTELEQEMYDLPYGDGIRSSSDLILAAASVANLTLTWLLFKHKRDRRKHH